MAKPPVVSLCCQVGRQVLDKFGPGVSQSQAGGLVEAVVVRLALGISGERGGAQTALICFLCVCVCAILLYENGPCRLPLEPSDRHDLKSL